MYSFKVCKITKNKYLIKSEKVVEFCHAICHPPNSIFMYVLCLFWCTKRGALWKKVIKFNVPIQIRRVCVFIAELKIYTLGTDLIIGWKNSMNPHCYTKKALVSYKNILFVLQFVFDTLGFHFQKVVAIKSNNYSHI